MEILDNASDRASLFFAAPETQLETIRRLRDSIDSVISSNPGRYRQILEDVIPVLIAVLKGGSPQFVPNTVQSIRATILDFFNQLPVKPELRDHVESIYNALIDVLNRDNELNALQCLSMIFDYHKAFHPYLESTVPHFMSFYSSMYNNLPRIVASTFPVRPGTPNTPAPSPNSSMLAMARASFRVLAASERIVRLFIQIYPKFADIYLGQLIPVMIKALRSEVSDRHAQKMAHQFTDFTIARVKTLSFLVFILRVCPDRMIPHTDDLSKSVFALLRSCPVDAAAVRRELLINMRQMVSLEPFCRNFRDKTDVFLKMYPQLMIGRGKAAQGVLRPLAASILIDLVSNLRGELSLDQLATAATIFCHHLHDPLLPFALQTSSAKLLFNLVDPIYQRDKEDIGRPRKIFIAVLYSLVSKFSSLQSLIPSLVESIRKMNESKTGCDDEPVPEQALLNSSVFRPENVLLEASRNPSALFDLHRDIKVLVSTMLFGLKTVVWSIKNSASTIAGGGDDNQVEMSLISDFLIYVIRALPVFAASLDQNASKRESNNDALSTDAMKPATASNETVLDNFASIFTALETRQFQSIFNEHIGDVIAFLDTYELELPVFAFAQHFLQNASMCKPFADLLLCHLLQPEQLKRLSDSNSVAAKTRLNLFRMILHALTIYTDVEFVIRPHLCRIVSQSLEHILSSDDPRAYFLVLRALFRNIGGGTFERLYKEFLPVMPELLTGLLTVIRSECARDVRDFAVELGLTVPARLSSLLPFIPNLIEIVAFALKSRTDSIIKLGLRTLEFWIDNLELDFLYPLIEKNLKNIMLGLCALINQHTTQFGPAAARVLGGLAGRSRHFLVDGLPDCLTYGSGCTGPRVFISDGVTITIRHAVRRLYRILFEEEKQPLPVVTFAANMAEHIIYALLACHQQARRRPIHESDMLIDAIGYSPDNGGASRVEEERIFSQMVTCMIAASARYKIASVQTCLIGLDKHFAILLGDLKFGTFFVANHIMKALYQAQSNQRFDSLVFLDVLLNCVRSHDTAVSSVAWQHLTSFLDDLFDVAGADALCRSHNAIQHIFLQAGHFCHYAGRHARLAGARVIAELATRLPAPWLHSNQNDLIRSLLFALRDSKSDIDLEIRRVTTRTLEQTIRTCSQIDSDLTLLVNNLASELTSATSAVRECIQNLLELVSQLCHTSICDLLKPFRTNLLTPVLSRRLHTLAPSTRIGYISATAYSLSIEPPLLDVSSEFFELLMSLATEIRHDESSALAGNPSVSPSSSHSGRSRLLMLQRVESIKLLSAALKSPQLQRHATVATPVTPDPSLLIDSVMSPSPAIIPDVLTPGPGPEADAVVTNLRNRIIAALFESLRSPHEEVAQAADRGMTLACEQERPPKALLQSCLRPVLSNFAEYQKLSVPLLTMLSRLLSVLSKCFNVTLAQKLYEHLENFTRMVATIAREIQPPLVPDPANPAGAQSTGASVNGAQRFGQWNEVLIPAAILDTFHLLPKLPPAFLQKLVAAVLQLETIFPILQVYGGCGHGPGSPYRLPLVRFLNHPDYCNDAAFFFVQPANLCNPGLSRLFKDCLKMGPDSERLCKAVRDLLPQVLCNAFVDRDDSAESAELCFQTISIIDILTSYGVSGCEVALDRLVPKWDERMSAALTTDADQDVVVADISSIINGRETLMLAHIFIRFCKAHPLSISVYLWKLLSFLIVRHLSDPTFLFDFITRDVVHGDQAEMVLLTFLNQLSRVPAAYVIKSKALDLVITPVFQRLVSEHRDLTQYIRIASNVLPPILTGQSSLPDVFNTALSNLTIHLILPSRSDPLFQASLLQYIWANTRHENTQVQLNAFVALGRFLKSLPQGTSASLDTIRLTLFVAILGMHQPSARSHTHLALKSILPGLTAAKAPVSTIPEFIRWTRRALSTDSTSDFSSIRHTVRIVCTFREHFEPFRSMLIPIMIPVLDRIVLPAASDSGESMQLSLDCVATIMSWAQMTDSTTNTIGDDRDPFVPPSLGDLSLLPALLQIAPDSPSNKRCRVSVASESLMAISPTSERHYSLEPIGGVLVSIIMNTADSPSLKFTHSRAQDQLRQFAVQHGSVLVRLDTLGAIASTASITDQQRLSGLNLIADLASSSPASCRQGAAHIVQLIRSCAQSENASVRLAMSSALTVALPCLIDNSHDFMQIVEVGLAQTNYQLHTAVEILRCLVAVKPSLIQNQIDALSKAVVVLARDCLSRQGEQRAPGSGPYRDVVSAMLTSLRLLAGIAHLPPEPYRGLLQTITLLTDKSTDLEVIQGIISVINSWVQNTLHFESTRKDIEAVIGRLIRFVTSSTRTPAFESSFFRLLMACSDGGLLGSMSLIPPMLLGLASTDAALRVEFVSRIQRYMLMNSAAEVDQKYSLLKFVFGDDNWELCCTTSPGLWMVAALQLILSMGSFNGTALIDDADNASFPFPQNATTSVLHAHRPFIDAITNIRPKDVLARLSDLIVLDAGSARCVWIELFPQIWASMPEGQRSSLQPLINTLLSRDWHRPHQSAQSNLVQIMLEGFVACRPDNTPIVPGELLGYLGRTYNAWYPALALLHRQTPQIEAHAAIAQTCSLLNERDILAGLWYNIAQSDITKSALALQQFGLWPRAQTMFFAALAAINGHSSSAPDIGVPLPEQGQVSALEANMWETEWTHAAWQLGQWDALSACAMSQHDLNTHVVAMCKLGNWSESFERAPSNSDEWLYKLCLSIVNKDDDLERTAERTMQALLASWVSLPSVVSQAHVPLLAQFHGFVEVQESSAMLTDVMQAKAQNKPVDLSSFIKIWRQRLPNEWEDLSFWMDRITWRLKTFDMIQYQIASTGALQTNSKSQIPSTDDRMWTLLTLSKVARKQQLGPHCLYALSQTVQYSENPITINDAFTRLREQVRVCMGTSIQYKEALSLLNSLNIDYFSPDQKAELFRLKGDALQHLGQGDDANACFSTALSVCETHGKSWLSWANFCDRVFAMKKDREWATWAVSCYMNAIAYGEARARLMITRVIWLLSYDAEDRSVVSAFERASEQVPLWTWLLWLPQLLTCLARPEGAAIKLILQRIARIYPQALHYTVRAFLFEKREQHAVSTKDGSSPDKASSDTSSLVLVESIVLAMRENHPSLVTEIENMLEEINLRFQPTPHEELLASVHSLYQKCFKQAVMVSGLSGPIPEPLASVLARLSRSFFNSPKHVSNPVQSEFVRRYKQAFEADFSSTGRITLAVLLGRLSKWKSHLEFHVTQRRRMSLRLESLSPYLMRFQTYEVEVPGQYLIDKEPSTDQNVLIVRFEPSVAIVRLSHTYLYRRLSLLGTDGVTYHFLVQYSIAHINRSDERMMQLYTIINRLMSRYKETRRRNLMFAVPLVVPLTHRLRLMETHDDVTSFEKVYEQSCTAQGISPDAPFSVVIEELSRVTELTPANIRASRLSSFKRIMGSVIPKTLLSDYFHTVIADQELLWAFRKQFAQQIGLNCFLSYILSIGDRSLHKILLQQQDGQITFNDFYPSYNVHNMIESSDNVPFRLTPNISTFIGDYLIHGITAATLVSLSACLLKHQDVLKNYLYLFVRDDLLSWHATKKTVQTDSAQRALEYDVRLQISSNTLQILRGIQSFMATSKSEGEEGHEPINAKVAQLIEQAMSEDNLSNQLPTWHPWF